MDTSNNSKIYRKLRGSEIRVLQFRPYSSALDNDKIECKLRYVSLDSSPDFFALSYVWGDASVTSTISLDGFDFQVTRNLFEAITQLRNRMNVDRTAYDTGVPDRIDDDDDHVAAMRWKGCAINWWIDAICIDQSSKNERNVQVPRMRQLYSTATRVIIWLGYLSEDYVEGILEDFPAAYSTSQALFAAKKAYQAVTDRGTDMFKLSNDRKIEILSQCVEYPERLIFPLLKMISLSEIWNSRLWTLQEAVLARIDPAIMIGNEVTTLRTFAWLQACVLAGVLVGSYSTYGHSNNAIKLYQDYFRTILSISEDLVTRREQTAQARDKFGLRHFAQELLERLTTVSGREATVPHDRIYGLLGLTRLPDLPTDLLPDYNRPYEEVFTTYTQFIIEHTSSISLVFYGPNQLHGYPSWVPDFVAGPMYRSIPKTRYQSAIIQKNGCLTVSGVKLGQVIFLYRVPSQLEPETLSLESLVHISNVWADFESSILQPSSRIRGCTVQVVMNEWADSFFSIFGGKVEDLQALSVIISNGGSEPPARSCVEALRSVFSLYHYILLDDGTICQYSSDACTFDREDSINNSSVWSMRGAGSPLILKPREGQNGFTILGQCVTIPRLRAIDSEEFLLANGEETIEMY